MGILSSITHVLSETPIGNFFDKVIDNIFPDKLSEIDRAKLRIELENFEHKRALEIQKLILEADAEFNQRIIEMEGTAGDLKAVPLIGPIILLFRGLMRPLWCYATFWLDYQWVSGAFGKLTETQEASLYLINFLVLGFLFSERAIKNTMPAISKAFNSSSMTESKKNDR